MSYDLAVIGSGPGGYVAAVRASQLGLKVICIDKRKTFGGTCLNVGCIPSKALLQDSELFELFQKHGSEHGLECKELKANFQTMMTRKNAVVKSNTDGIDFLFKKNKIVGVHGEARLLSPNEIQVGKEQFQAKNIILATGSEAIELPFLKFDEKRIVSSTGALELEAIPKKMVVIGAGVIGLEIASIYRRLGSEVVLVEMLPQIATGLDEAIIKNYYQILQQQGLQFHLNAQVKSAKIDDKNIALAIAKEDAEFVLETDSVLVAVGRRPYTQGLGLKEIGIPTTDLGQVTVDGSFRTVIPNIYAIGDLIDGPMLAHKASEEGVVAAEIIAGKKSEINYWLIPNIIYTHPEAAAIGFTEQEAKNAGLDIFTGSCPFRSNPRARCIGELDGFVKVIGEKNSGRLIGMHILGVQASELIAEGMVALKSEATIEELASCPNGHPTLSEAIKEACLVALKRPINL